MKLPPQERIFYVAVQDGRLDKEEFKSYNGAEAHRKTLKKSCKMLYASTCVMSYVRNVE